MTPSELVASLVRERQETEKKLESNKEALVKKAHSVAFSLMAESLGDVMTNTPLGDEIHLGQENSFEKILEYHREKNNKAPNNYYSYYKLWVKNIIDKTCNLLTMARAFEDGFMRGISTFYIDKYFRKHNNSKVGSKLSFAEDLYRVRDELDAAFNAACAMRDVLESIDQDTINRSVDTEDGEQINICPLLDSFNSSVKAKMLLTHISSNGKYGLLGFNAAKPEYRGNSSSNRSDWYGGLESREAQHNLNIKEELHDLSFVYEGK